MGGWVGGWVVVVVVMVVGGGSLVFSSEAPLLVHIHALLAGAANPLGDSDASEPAT